MSIDIQGWVEGWHLERVLHRVGDDASFLWKRINPTVQNIIIQSSAVVEVINSMLTATPQFVKDLIFSRIPGVTEDVAVNALNKAGATIGIIESVDDADLLTTIKNAQLKLSTLKGEEWKAYSESLSSWIAFYSTPHDTTFTIIASIIKFVYKNFVQKRIM